MAQKPKKAQNKTFNKKILLFVFFIRFFVFLNLLLTLSLNLLLTLSLNLLLILPILEGQQEAVEAQEVEGQAEGQQEAVEAQEVEGQALLIFFLSIFYDFYF
jgi:hypothetical protein